MSKVKATKAFRKQNKVDFMFYRKWCDKWAESQYIGVFEAPLFLEGFIKELGKDYIESEVIPAVNKGLLCE